MRKTWDSANTSSTRRLSSRADARSWPNGFSITTRVSACSQRCRLADPNFSTITGKNSGAVER